LESLSPLADSALDIAKEMNKKDFLFFKKALLSERRQEIEGEMPEKYMPLLIPDRFDQASLLLEKFQAPLGATLIRIIETEGA